MSKKKSLFNLFSLRGIKSKQGNSFVNSQLKLASNRLLKINDYEKLLEQDSISDVYKLLEEHYDYQIDETLTLQRNFRDMFENYIEKMKKSIGSKLYGSHNHSFIEKFFFIPLDFFNLKVLTKGLLENYEFSNLPFSSLGYLSVDHLNSLYNGNVLGFFNPETKKAWNIYFRDKEKIKSPYDLDLFWDKQLHLFYTELFKKMDSEILTCIYKTQIDIKNILTTLRLKVSEKDKDDVLKTILPHGNIHKQTLLEIFQGELDTVGENLDYPLYYKELRVGIEAFEDTNSFSTLEKFLSEYLLKIYKRLLSLTADEDLAIIYSWLKQNEFSNLQMIISGKLNNIHSSWVLSKLKVAI